MAARYTSTIERSIHENKEEVTVTPSGRRSTMSAADAQFPPVYPSHTPLSPMAAAKPGTGVTGLLRDPPPTNPFRPIL